LGGEAGVEHGDVGAVDLGGASVVGEGEVVEIRGLLFVCCKMKGT
jgi:hypothetical protein